MQLTAYCKGLLHFIREHNPQLTKMWLVMRLTMILLTVAVLQVSARGYSQGITLDMHHAPLAKVLGEIRKQSGCYFIYGQTVMARALRVDVDVKNASLDSVLALIFREQPLGYRVSDKFVMIAPREEMPSQDQAAEAPADVPPGDVQGRVVNEKGEILAGATILVKGSRKGAISGTDGTFVLHGMSVGNTLVVSFTGYGTQEIAVGAGAEDRALYLNVNLKPSLDPIDEVQIIAYGRTTKRLNLGNVTTVGSAEIEKQPVDNLILALQGQVPGLQISAVTNSLPGAGPQVKIRGTNSIAAGTAPLYILDGVPVPETENGIVGFSYSQSALININPADIESIEVLKDADATSIYGSRGANGVILITTKKGKIGKTGVSVNAYTGMGKVPHFIDMMNVHQYNAMRRGALANDKMTPNTTNAADLLTWDSTKVTNWQKFFIGGSAPTQDMEVGVGGGSVTSRFTAGVGYHNEGTTLPGNNTGATRKSARVNFDHNSPDGKFGVSATSAYSITTLNLMPLDLTSSINFAPDYPIYTPTGTPNWNGVRGYPLAYLQQPYASRADNYNGHALLRYTPIKGLNLKLDAGFNNTQINETLKEPSVSLSPTSGQPAELIVGNFYNRTWIAEPQADYTLRFNRHQVTLLAGGTWQQNENNSFTAFGMNFPNDALIGNLSSASTITASTAITNYAYNSFFSRLNYNWDERYLVNASFRRDGSSRFGPGKRFGDFGAVAAGWIFTKEDFMKSVRFLSFGKLRASYGTNGNDQINDYGYLTTYGNGGLYQTTSLTTSTLANPNYRWEQDRKLEIGLELGALKDRILLKSSFFRNRTGNQLLYYGLSPQTGFTGYQANFPALIQNQGFEFELNTKNIVTKHFSWTTSANFSWTHNKLLKFPSLAQSSYSSQYFIGKSLLVRQAYQFKGLDSTGKPVYADNNKDGVISSLDRVVVGDQDPMFGGITNKFDYKGISLSFLWEYDRFRNFNNAIPASRNGAQGTNATLLALKAWQKPGDEQHTTLPLYTTSSATYNAQYYSQSTVLWGSSNIFRLRNLSLSYSLPDELLKKAKIQQVRVYMLGQNLWVFDPLKKYRLDPETGNGGMPPLRIWTFGINCTF
jgi:TonB-linked SusC/RagA family outer membrane protein